MSATKCPIIGDLDVYIAAFAYIPMLRKSPIIGNLHVYTFDNRGLT